MDSTGSTPRPDPTILTTQQLLREIATSREVVEKTLEGFRTVLETRLDGMDKAISLTQSHTDKLPSVVMEAVGQLQRLHEEKFRSVEKQFTERDTRTDKMAEATSTAVTAALQAAKEAVGKQSDQITKQIDQIVVLITTMQKGQDDKTEDIKSRMNMIESRLNGLEGQRKGAGDVWGYVIGFVGVLVAAVTAIATVLLVKH
jgi:hypothetical protein